MLLEREMTCCFTGHRPGELFRGGKQMLSKISKVRSQLRQHVEKAIELGYRCFLFDGTEGVSNWAAEIVLEKKAELPEHNIQLVCALLYPGYGDRWNIGDILTRCDDVIVIGQQGTIATYRKRMVFMVEHADRMIAVFNGNKGSIRNTIDYAKRKGIDVEIIAG